MRRSDRHEGSLPWESYERQRRILWNRQAGRPQSDPRGVCWVPKVTLWEFVADESYVDLLDIDIQGLELRFTRWSTSRDAESRTSAYTSVRTHARSRTASQVCSPVSDGSA